MSSGYLNSKIAVVGAGGVGGYLAGMLAGACPHVTVVARGARGESIRRDGLILHSDHNGERTARPEYVLSSSRELEPQDYIFICVKNYSLETACEELRGAIGKDTAVIPVMNGADVGNRVREYLDTGNVIDSVIYIVAFANPDYSITQQGNFASMRIGTDREELEGAVKAVSEILAAGGIDHKISKDITRDIWRKYILNCAYNVATAYYDNTIGELRRDETKAGEYEALIREAYEIARAKGVSVTEKDTAQMIRSFRNEIADNATSSLQRDIRAGKPAETDIFSGYLVREGNRLGIGVPVTEKMYRGLIGKESG